MQALRLHQVAPFEKDTNQHYLTLLWEIVRVSGQRWALQPLRQRPLNGTPGLFGPGGSCIDS